MAVTLLTSLNINITLAARWSILSTTLLTAIRISVLCCRASVIKKEVTSPGAWMERREISSHKGKIPAHRHTKNDALQFEACQTGQTFSSQNKKGHGIWKTNNVGISQITQIGGFMTTGNSWATRQQIEQQNTKRYNPTAGTTVGFWNWTEKKKNAPRKVQLYSVFTNRDYYWNGSLNAFGPS